MYSLRGAVVTEKATVVLCRTRHAAQSQRCMAIMDSEALCKCIMMTMMKKTLSQHSTPIVIIIIIIIVPQYI